MCTAEENISHKKNIRVSSRGKYSPVLCQEILSGRNVPHAESSCIIIERAVLRRGNNRVSNNFPRSGPRGEAPRGCKPADIAKMWRIEHYSSTQLDEALSSISLIFSKVFFSSLVLWRSSRCAMCRFGAGDHTQRAIFESSRMSVPLFSFSFSAIAPARR